MNNLDIIWRVYLIIGALIWIEETHLASNDREIPLTPVQFVYGTVLAILFWPIHILIFYVLKK